MYVVNILLMIYTLFRFRLHPSLDLANVAEKCPFNYTGADFYALCSDAMLKAMSRTADSIENRVGMLGTDLQYRLHDYPFFLLPSSQSSANLFRLKL